MALTPIYDLPEWASQQASPWLKENEVKRVLEAVARGVVEDVLAAPPGSCADGDCFLVDTGATDDWLGEDGAMAVAVGANASNGWLFPPVTQDGQMLWIVDEQRAVRYRTGTGWVDPLDAANIAFDGVYSTDVQAAIEAIAAQLGMTL